MLGLAEQAIGFVQNVIFLIVQAADFFERLHGEERIALPNLGQIVAVG